LWLLAFEALAQPRQLTGWPWGSRSVQWDQLRIPLTAIVDGTVTFDSIQTEAADVPTRQKVELRVSGFTT